jgi:hypothetical protein
MTAAIATLRSRVPRGAAIFTDRRSIGQLEYYLGDSPTGGWPRWWLPHPWRPRVERFVEAIGEHTAVYSPGDGWMLDARHLGAQLELLGARAEVEVWIFDAGEADLPSTFAESDQAQPLESWPSGSIILARMRPLPTSQAPR